MRWISWLSCKETQPLWVEGLVEKRSRPNSDISTQPLSLTGRRSSTSTLTGRGRRSGCENASFSLTVTFSEESSLHASRPLLGSAGDMHLHGLHRLLPVNSLSSHRPELY